jgi:hypothetical protein
VENLSRSIPALLKSLLVGAGEPGPAGRKHGGRSHIAITARRAGQASAKGGVCQCFIVLILLSFWSCAASAQELTPRAYWPAPEGTRAAFVGYSRATGDVLFDPSIPLYGVDSKLHNFVLAYRQTFSLFDRTTNFVVELPYSTGTTTGFIVDQPATGDYSGLGDIGITLSVNLLGAPSMSVQEFQALRANPRPILGASIKVLLPTGRYDSGRLLNVGMNRIAIKPELGLALPLSEKWIFETEAGAWIFGDDPDFFTGYREQAPIWSAEFHLVRRFRPGFWASLDANYFTGGRQRIGGVRLTDVQRNAKAGFTLVVPFKGRHAVKLGYSTGVITEFGTDFDQFLLSYQTVLK